ncbi:hypothetical protein [Microvirga lotononidis]|uniref:Uncharacterized protein n=1 Tax=Microvirga lotononidis TaxID=864069 RepID=I4Z2M0_9HYPH|nr:hypothetical protein [Microvirga lotononidis]EIM30462.1 hypothetical protein MicloDRAFT_00007110 [Microvirga lotononidis]WQO26302.1 hypothetical protein U0023_16585 [Microvirga lotononidis]
MTIVMTFRTVLAVLICAPLIAFAGGLAFVFWNVGSCSNLQKIDTSEDALEFGKYWLRRDERFWRAKGVKSLTDLNLELEKVGCCTVEEIVPSENDGRMWSTALRLGKASNDLERYEVQFTSCRYEILTKITHEEH